MGAWGRGLDSERHRQAGAEAGDVGGNSTARGRGREGRPRGGRWGAGGAGENTSILLNPLTSIHLLPCSLPVTSSGFS